MYESALHLNLTYYVKTDDVSTFITIVLFAYGLTVNWDTEINDVLSTIVHVFNMHPGTAVQVKQLQLP